MVSSTEGPPWAVVQVRAEQCNTQSFLLCHAYGVFAHTPRLRARAFVRQGVVQGAVGVVDMGLAEGSTLAAVVVRAHPCNTQLCCCVFLLCIYSHPLPLARASVRRGVVAGFVTNVQTDLAEGSTVAWGGRGDRGRTRWRRRRRVPWHGKASVQRTMRGSGDGGQRRADNGGAGITAPDKIGRRRFSSVRRPCRTQLCLRYRTQLLCKIQPCPRKLLIHVPGMYAYVPARNIVVLWESSRAAHQSTDSCARNGS